MLLHNDSLNKREYVVQVLLKARVARREATRAGCARALAPRAAQPRAQPRRRAPAAAARRSRTAQPCRAVRRSSRAQLSPARAFCVCAQVVDGMTTEHAYDIMQEAHAYGLALVLVTVQEEAEAICEALRNNGLVSTVEPDSGGRRGAGGGDGGSD